MKIYGCKNLLWEELADLGGALASGEDIQGRSLDPLSTSNGIWLYAGGPSLSRIQLTARTSIVEKIFYRNRIVGYAFYSLTVWNPGLPFEIALTEAFHDFFDDFMILTDDAAAEGRYLFPEPVFFDSRERPLDRRVAVTTKGPRYRSPLAIDHDGFFSLIRDYRLAFAALGFAPNKSEANLLDKVWAESSVTSKIRLLLYPYRRRLYNVINGLNGYSEIFTQWPFVDNLPTDFDDTKSDGSNSSIQKRLALHVMSTLPLRAKIFLITSEHQQKLECNLEYLGEAGAIDWLGERYRSEFWTGQTTGGNFVWSSGQIELGQRLIHVLGTDRIAKIGEEVWGVAGRSGRVGTIFSHHWDDVDHLKRLAPERLSPVAFAIED